MYKSIWEFTRPSLETPWAAGSSELETQRSQSAGFVSKVVNLSADALTKTVTTTWDTEQDALNFLNNHGSLVESVNQLLITHCEENGITLTRSIE